MEEKQLLEQLPYAYFLHRLWGLNNKRMWQLTKKVGMPEMIYKETEALKELLEEKKLQQLAEAKQLWEPQREWERLKKQGIRFLPFFHPDYPQKLKEIPDSPWGLYVLGKLPDREQASVAIVGARQCSEYGKMMADQLGKKLGEREIPVVSGMARGIDGISQMAALETGGESFAVLGCGVDVCYPKENRKLYECLKEKGGILSEYPPGTRPLAAFFPPRNRIISGLCDVLVVVEAKEKSGTLITVDMALEQGKEVLVVPGRITDALSRGCNRLVKQGAGIVTSLEDIISLLPEGQKHTGRIDIEEKTVKLSFANELEKRVYGLLDFAPKNIEQIWQEYGIKKITLPELMQILMELCLKETAATAGSSYWKKAK